MSFVNRFVSVFLIWLVLLGSAFGQTINFKAQNQYNKCAELFQQKLFEAANNACQLAEIQQPNYSDSLRLHARVALRLNNTVAAQGFINQARVGDPTNPQNDVISAEIVLKDQNYEQASQLAQTALQNPRLSLKSKVLAYKIIGQTAQIAGNEADALLAYRNALDLDASDTEVRLALSQILIKSDPKASENLLRNSPSRPLELLAEYGRTQWVAGNLPGAIQTLEGLFATNKSGMSETLRQRAYGALAYAYYGMGNVTEGSKVLAFTSNSNGLFALIVTKTLPWLIAMVALLITHLVGESQIEPLSTIEIQDGPRPWTVASVYSHLIVAVLLGGAAALIGGHLIYGNYLALFTPVQVNVAKDLFFGFFAITLLGLAWYTTQKNGWNARQLLLGVVEPSMIAEGIAVGIAITAFALVYQYAVKQLNFPSGFYLHLEYWRVSALLPILLLPFTEIFFRAFAVFPIEKRYGQIIGAVILVLLFAITFVAPIILVAFIGAGLLYYTNRQKSVVPAIVGQLVFYLALLFMLSSFPIVRSWF